MPLAPWTIRWYTDKCQLCQLSASQHCEGQGNQLYLSGLFGNSATCAALTVMPPLRP